MSPVGSSLSRMSVLTLAVALGACSAQAPPASLDDLAQQTLAQIDGQLSVPGLLEAVEVIRDEWGIPHIYAQNDDDLFFAQGYVMAQDRLWQMEMWRRWHEGRLSEIFGSVALDYDKRSRLMMFRGPGTILSGLATTQKESASSLPMLMGSTHSLSKIEIISR